MSARSARSQGRSGIPSSAAIWAINSRTDGTPLGSLRGGREPYFARFPSVGLRLIVRLARLVLICTQLLDDPACLCDGYVRPAGYRGLACASAGKRAVGTRKKILSGLFRCVVRAKAAPGHDVVGHRGDGSVRGDAIKVNNRHRFASFHRHVGQDAKRVALDFLAALAVLARLCLVTTFVFRGLERQACLQCQHFQGGRLASLT